MLSTPLLGLAASLLPLLAPTLVEAQKADMILFKNPNCSGTLLACTNVGPRLCCINKYGGYHSGKCNGCAPSWYNILWTRNGADNCGSICDLSSGGRCASCTNVVGGHSWAKPTSKRDENELEERGFECEKQIDPDRMSKDGKVWFKINHDVPQHVTKMLLDWGDDDNATHFDLPMEAWNYRIDI